MKSQGLVIENETSSVLQLRRTAPPKALIPPEKSHWGSTKYRFSPFERHRASFVSYRGFCLRKKGERQTEVMGGNCFQYNKQRNGPVQFNVSAALICCWGLLNVRLILRPSQICSRELHYSNLEWPASLSPLLKNVFEVYILFCQLRVQRNLRCLECLWVYNNEHCTGRRQGGKTTRNMIPKISACTGHTGTFETQQWQWLVVR